LLSIRAEPPEQLLPLSPTGQVVLDGGINLSALLFGDGGVCTTDGGCLVTLPFGDGGITLDAWSDGGVTFTDGGPLPFLGGPAQIKPVTLTGLVADPEGGGRPIHYTFSVCAHLDPNNRCDPDAPGYQLITDQTLTVTSISNEMSATFTPSAELLTQAVQLDPYHAFGGLPLQTQLEVQAGNEHVVATKFVVFTPPYGTAPVIPNTNPQIDGLQLDGSEWSATNPPTVVGGALGSGNGNPRGGGSVNFPDGGGGHDIAPEFDVASQEVYTHPTFTGGIVTLHEAFRFNFFATLGSFNPAVSGGVSNGITNNTNPKTDSHWRPDQNDGEQDVTFWVVVRDGRGGENWIVRRAHFTPQ
jgi:hypothetical protein